MGLRLQGKGKRRQADKDDASSRERNRDEPQEDQADNEGHRNRLPDKEGESAQEDGKDDEDQFDIHQQAEQEFPDLQAWKASADGHHLHLLRIQLPMLSFHHQGREHERDRRMDRFEEP